MRGPYVVLSPISKSHPFEERKAKVGPEDDPLKIGRAVAKLKAAKDNAIFDCKVLSRNHAIMWHKEGEFFLKDTKSSNGTFVNDDRLAVTGEESEAKQIFTGDIVQFGVEIVEHTNKVAHGCIYAMVQLFDNEGQLLEAASSTFSHNNEIGNSSTMLSKQQLFQLQQYTSEAIYREETRQQKLEALQKILEEAEQKTESSWKQLVNDDILLTKIAALEIQLATYAKSATPDKMRDELLQMTEDRVKFELNTKDIIRRLEDEKTETAMRLQDAERSLVQTEEECIWMRDNIKTLETRLKEMTTVSDAKQAELNTAAQTLHEMEKQREVLEKKLKKVEDRIAEMERVWICPERRGSAPNIVKAINDNWILDTEAVKLIYEACRARLAGQFYDMSSLPYHSPALNALKETTSLPIKSTLELCAAQSSSCTDNNDSEGAEQVITNGTNGETKEKRNRISSSPAPEQTMQNGTHDAEEKKENLDRNQREIKSETPDSIVETLNTNSEIEHYLKENLELQARIKNVEMDLSEARAQVQQKDAELRNKAASLERLETAMKTGSTSTLTSVSQFQGISSSTASASCTSTGISVSRQKDSMMQQALVLSLVPLFAFLLLLISPIHRRIFPVANSPTLHSRRD